jgi:hypothetical protein
LSSIADQTVRPDEVIVVDDGSEPPLSLSQSFPGSPDADTAGEPCTGRGTEPGDRGGGRGVDRAARLGRYLDPGEDRVPARSPLELFRRAEFCVSNMTTHAGRRSSFRWIPGRASPTASLPDALERLLPGPVHQYVGRDVSRNRAFERAGRFDEGLWFCEDHDMWVRLAAVTPVVATTRRR